MTQQEYIEILLNDCGIDTVKKRNDFLTNFLGRRIDYLDTFDIHNAPFGPNTWEKSRIIQMLKDRKADG